MKKLLGIVVLLVVLVGGWYYASPRWTLHSMAQAAEDRDAASLSAHIDYPSLRESVKAQLGARLATRADRSSDAGLGAILAVGLVGSMVDALLTPEAMRATFDAPADGSKKPLGFSAKDARIAYDGIDHFRLVPNDGSGGALVFTRYGLGWKLSGVRLPRKGTTENIEE